MNRQGVGTQSLRSMSNTFFSPQLGNTRQQPMANHRIPNGKIGGGATGWGSGIPLGGAPGFSNPPTRTNTMPNFAQAIGGGASGQTSLDMSEFPSLSGGPQAQNHNPMSQAWNSNALRQSSAAQQGPQRQATLNDVSRPPPPAAFAFGGNLDETFGNRASAPSRTEGNQNQHGGGDDFPPLGGLLTGDTRHDRSGGLPQSIGLGGAFGGQVNGQADGEAFGVGNPDAVRSPHEAHRTSSNPLMGQQSIPFRDGPFSSARQAPVGQSAAVQQTNQGTDFGLQMMDFPANNQTQPARRQLSELNESEKWGLPGLVAMLPGRTSGSTGIIVGQDLNSLGIDFDSAEPLFPTFSTPFADASSRPAIPDFCLPSAYSVHNVPPLHNRMVNFSDETLFAIFYQFARDVMQENAAAELYSRDWRWHKELRQWMMKDATMAQPIRVTERSERGVYIFFDAINWRKERREFLLQYDHLDQRHGPPQLVAAQ